TNSPVEEPGLSFVENAILKARYAARSGALTSIADDSGLEVDALRGAPGICSARYAGPNASDRDNNETLLRVLRETRQNACTARYRCALAFVRGDSDAFPIVYQASWEGTIIDVPRGDGGFGYDPIFELPERGHTAAELSAEE